MKWGFVGLGIISLCAIVFVVFCVNKETDKPSVYFDEKEMKADEVLPEGDFITKGNWTVFKFKTDGSFDIGSVSEILDRFEKKHPKLCVKNGDWDVHPYGILLRHFPTN